jgi:ABC-type uncharacterized transport system substrate-binding protein
MRTLPAAYLICFQLYAAQASVVVAYESGVGPFDEALDGLKAVLGPNGVQAMDLRVAGSEPELMRVLAMREVRVVIAIGSNSLAVVGSRNPAIPLVTTMVLHAPDSKPGSHVDLDLPLDALLGEMRVLLPQRRRVGVIRGRAYTYQTTEAIEAAARKEGFTAVVVDCDGPANLLKSVAALKGRVDFVLCFPDADLYNAVTIKPLILASLEDRLPVIGFSAAFVRAGAAAGIYPDYREIGRQTAEMALRVMRGEQRGSEEGPRKFHVAVNQRVARLLGVEFQIDASSVEVFK